MIFLPLVVIFFYGMNLIADIGNTLIKTAVFAGDEIIFEEQAALSEVDSISITAEKFSVKNAIISSVAGRMENISHKLKDISFLLIADHNTPVPIKNSYLTGETLGFDRLAAAVGANTIFPGSNVLVIDAGTAITIDMVTGSGEYLGGNISPGLDIRFKALNFFTKRLPLIKKEGETGLTGKTTEEAIRFGVWNGIIYELDGYIYDYKQKFKDLKIILTGGDHKHFDKKLKNSIFVDSNLNLKGLNQILQYNAK